MSRPSPPEMSAKVLLFGVVFGLTWVTLELGDHAGWWSVLGRLVEPGPPSLVAPATVRRLEPEAIELIPPMSIDPDLASDPCSGITITDTDARALRCRMSWLAEAGRHDRALLRLAELKALVPRLTDRLSLLEGRYRLAAAKAGAQGLDPSVCSLFREATSSPTRAISAEARVERVRCLLALGAPEAEEALESLERRYRRLPQRLELQFLLARARESAHNRPGAVAIYREIDLRHPGSEEARLARRRLEALRASGVEVRPLSVPERIARLGRLARTGPLELAHQELRALRAMKLTRPSAARVAAIGARIARREGRYDEARRLLAEVQRLARGGQELRETAREAEQRLAGAAERDPERARATIRRLVGSKPPPRVRIPRLYLALQYAVRAGIRSEVDRLLGGMVGRRALTPQVAFDAGILASGAGDEELVAGLFQRASEWPPLAVAATYHRARALERKGDLGEARRLYLQVLERDRGRTPFYAFWARQRLPLVEAAMAERCEPERGEETIPSSDRAGSCPAPRPGSYRRQATEPERPDLSPTEVAERLDALAKKHGSAFPWFARAADLVRLGLPDEAADELHEAAMAWREARGRRPMRSGLEALYRGGAPPPLPADRTTRQARRKLSAADLVLLSEASAALGDDGLAIRYGGWHLAGRRPRAYEEEVLRAAHRHGVDPNLLLAVMRVESVYNRRIISYAGAVGLMQIMPATAHFIARRQGRRGFTMNDMFDPEVNIDFAAWYLASLLDRFDRHVPLAVAAYNGGPHNVRLWIDRSGPDMPLDAFLETIPFGQTHRYVRRVLTHWEAYRAQRGLDMPTLDLSLPLPRPDPVAF